MIALKPAPNLYPTTIPIPTTSPPLAKKLLFHTLYIHCCMFTLITTTSSMLLLPIIFSLCLLIIPTSVTPFSLFGNRSHQVTILLDPAGDARHAGRKLGTHFERGITLQCTERLKEVLEQTYPYVRVVLTRLPGEVEQPLQHANFANRLHADLYIRIHFYQEASTKPHWYIYYFSYGDDFIVSPSSSLTLYPYDKAHLINKQRTEQFATSITQILKQEQYAQHYICDGAYRIPLRPLIGIKAPAFVYEIGLKNPQDWTRVVEAAAASLAPIISECQLS